MSTLMQNVKFVQALGPDADRYSGDPATDVINMQDWSEITFVLHVGVGTVGTAILTIESVDNVAGDNPVEVPFQYKIVTATDVEGAFTAAAAAGFTTTAGSNNMFICRLLAEDLDGTQQFVRMVLTEAAATAVDAGVLAILSGGRYHGDSTRTAIV
jgi:hypothetical protein